MNNLTTIGFDQILNNVNDALLNLSVHEEFSLFSLYPNHCCEYASLLLAKYLEEEFHVANIYWVLGEYKKNGIVRHIWLEVDNIYLDITKHQFDFSKGEDSFAVLKSDDSWYKSHFKIIKRYKRAPNWTDFKEEFGFAMDDYYRQIVDHVNNYGQLISDFD